MKVKPVLDNWELKGLQHIEIDEKRMLVEHKVPGLDGSMFQNLGTGPGRIFLSGSIQGDELKGDFLEQIRKKFTAATPVPFIADITTASDIKEVIIENLFFTETAHATDTIHYKIWLQEFTRPPEDEGLQLDSLEAGLDLEAGLAVEGITAPLLGDLQAATALADGLDKCGSVLDGLDELGGLDALSGPLGDLAKELISELAEALGIAGYNSVDEVFEDLMGGVGDMVSKDIGEWGSVIGSTFTKVIPKLLITLLAPPSGDWKALTNSFKDGFSELFG